MKSRRALVPLEDLRRWAKVAREEGVSIHGTRAPDGGITIVVNPATATVAQPGEDLDAALERYLAR